MKIDLLDLEVNKVIDYISKDLSLSILFVKEEGLIQEIFACRKISFAYQDVRYIEFDGCVITNKFVLPFNFDVNYKKLLNKILTDNENYIDYKLSDNSKWFLIERK